MKIVISEDGSPTLYSDAFKESYHSFRGALAESVYVYIKNGLDKWFKGQKLTDRPIRIFEMGFGTGLNLLLAHDWAVRNKQRIEFVSIELWPLPSALLHDIAWEKYGFVREWALQLHDAPCEQTVSFGDGLSLYKINKDFTTWVAEAAWQNSFDVIFYDAFGPRKQPELWTLEQLEKSCLMLRDGGLFCTYSAQSRFRRHLDSLGMQTEKFKGPLGKKHMVVAWKPLGLSE